MEKDEFELSNVNPMDIGRHLHDVYNEYGYKAAEEFTDRLSAKFSISVINSDKDDGLPSEYIYNKIKAYIIFCGILYENKLKDENRGKTNE
jgi:hypothetical protein